MVGRHSYDYHIRRGKISDTFIVFIRSEGVHSTSFCHKFVGILNKGVLQSRAYFIFFMITNFLYNTMFEASFVEKRINYHF